MGDCGGYDDLDFVAEFYDHVGRYRDRQDVSFYVDTARQSGGPVLEIGCGTGRILIPTAQASVRSSALTTPNACSRLAERSSHSSPRKCNREWNSLAETCAASISAGRSAW